MDLSNLINAIEVDSIMYGCMFISISLMAIFEAYENKVHNLNLHLWPWLLIFAAMIDIVIFSSWLGLDTVLKALFDTTGNTKIIKREVSVGIVLTTGAIIQLLYNYKVIKLNGAKYACGIAFVLCGFIDIEYHAVYGGFNVTTTFNNYYIIYFSITLILVGLLQLIQKYNNVTLPYKVIWAIVLISHGALNIVAKPSHKQKFIFNGSLPTVHLPEFLFDVALSLMISFILLVLFVFAYRAIHSSHVMELLREKLKSHSL